MLPHCTWLTHLPHWLFCPPLLLARPPLSARTRFPFKLAPHLICLMSPAPNTDPGTRKCVAWMNERPIASSINASASSPFGVSFLHCSLSLPTLFDFQGLEGLISQAGTIVSSLATHTRLVCQTCCEPSIFLRKEAQQINRAYCVTAFSWDLTGWQLLAWHENWHEEWKPEHPESMSQNLKWTSWCAR